MSLLFSIYIHHERVGRRAVGRRNLQASRIDFLQVAPCENSVSGQLHWDLPLAKSGKETEKISGFGADHTVMTEKILKNI